MSLLKGKTVIATVAPTGQALLARFAASRYERALAILPDWYVRPALGVSLYHTPDGRFPKYVATNAPNSLKRIVESGSRDARLLYGVTIGLTYRPVDKRDWRLPVSFWLPEVFVNPLDQNRAFGIGIGLSMSVFKFGTGYGWVRHQELNGQFIDSTLTDANLLKLNDIYGQARRFYSVSVTGWPPFLRAK